MTIGRYLAAMLAAVVLCACSDDVCEALVADPAMKGRIIAHRGLWHPDVSRQNTVQSLRAAAEAGYYGAETDVWQTADGYLVLNHDHDYAGAAITANAYSAIGRGSMPLLSDALRAMRQYGDFRLFIEVKQADPEAVATATDGYDRVEFLSFDPGLCEKLIGLTSKPVYLLAGESLPEPAYLLEKGYAGVSASVALLYGEPGYVARLRQSGLRTIVWTVNNSADAHYFESIGVDYITADVSKR